MPQQNPRKVLLIGTGPPPPGGVTVYVKRITDKLSSEPYFDFIDTKSAGRQLKVFSLIAYVRKNNIKALHLNGMIKGNAAFRYLMIMALSGVSIIITYHNDRFGEIYNRMNRYDRFFTRALYRRIDTLISAKEDAEYVFVDKRKIANATPYIEPSDEEINAELPEIAYEARKQHRILITANASKVAFHKGTDLYGIDISIELTKRLLEAGYENIGFLYVIGRSNDDEYIAEMRELIRQYQMEKNFCILTEAVHYAGILNLSDIFIRPTNTDSFGISVQEALFLGKPAIVSDVCCRSEGSTLFENRNIEDLFQKVKYTIDNIDGERDRVSKVVSRGCIEDLLDIYEATAGICLPNIRKDNREK